MSYGNDNYMPHMCPNICPGAPKPPEETRATELLKNKGPTYTPGSILPPEPYVYGKNDPPKYFPQPADTVSGDILTMNPTGPWAAGHIDWSPTAGMTGLRPVVDKYSLTRYSTGEWRKTNKNILAALPDQQAREFHSNTQKFLENVLDVTQTANDKSNKKLKERVNELRNCTIEVEKSLNRISDEIIALEGDRMMLKTACQVLMLPESIAKECLELRTHRLEPDMVRDDAEMELISEVSLVGEIRRLFNETLNKVEVQLKENMATKAVIEGDWSDKFTTLNLDRYNLSLDENSNTVLHHPGVKRWPENQCTLEYWRHYCKESVRNCEDVIAKSQKLRSNLKTVIVKGGQDMKTQSERVNNALSETIDSTQKLCYALEEQLKKTLHTIADMENQIDDLQEALRVLKTKDKTMMTRIYARNYERRNVENCRDEAQYALMGEGKLLSEKIEETTRKIKEADIEKAKAEMFRGKLEKEIASKRKCLLIDRDRLTALRVHLPKPEEYNVTGEEE